MVALDLAARLTSRAGSRMSALSRNQSGCVRVRRPKAARAQSKTVDLSLDHVGPGLLGVGDELNW